jgi:RNA polymerase sigma-70 factor (TIGR02960 family)
MDGDMTGDLISRAQAGDENAFRALVEPHRRELLVHCYRMLGSLHDAEDVLQDVLLAAWHGLKGFEGRASPRTWLYRIATNRCLNARRAANRRPAVEWSIPGIEPPEPSSLGELPWLEPFPDAMLEGIVHAPPGPEARYSQTQSISLAFVCALQVLPPSQLAVVILRDVLDFSAKEAANMLDTTVQSANGALKRARANLKRQLPPVGERESGRASGPRSEDALVAKFVSAYEAADLEALVALLTSDVFMSMPPMRLEYRGRDAVASFCAILFGSGRGFDLVPTRANGQPAFGVYVRSAATGVSHGSGLIALAIEGDRISAMTRFDKNVLLRFDLPRTLENR